MPINYGGAMGGAMKRDPYKPKPQAQGRRQPPSRMGGAMGGLMPQPGMGKPQASEGPSGLRVPPTMGGVMTPPIQAEKPPMRGVGGPMPPIVAPPSTTPGPSRGDSGPLPPIRVDGDKPDDDGMPDYGKPPGRFDGPMPPIQVDVPPNRGGGGPMPPIQVGPPPVLGGPMPPPPYGEAPGRGVGGPLPPIQTGPPVPQVDSPFPPTQTFDEWRRAFEAQRMREFGQIF